MSFTIRNYLITAIKLIIVQPWKTLHNLTIEFWINKASLIVILEKNHKVKVTRLQKQEPQLYQIWMDFMVYLNSDYLVSILMPMLMFN